MLKLYGSFIFLLLSLAAAKAERTHTVSKKLSWNDALEAAPNLVSSLSYLAASSSKVDFKIDTSTLHETSRFRHSRFRPSVLQLINDGWRALSDAESATQTIRLNSASFAVGINKALNFMTSPNPAVVKRFGMLPVKSISLSLQSIRESLYTSIAKLTQWRLLQTDLDEALQATTIQFARQGVKTEERAMEVAIDVAMLKREYEKAKKVYEESTKELDLARQAYDTALSAFAENEERGNWRRRGGTGEGNGNALITKEAVERYKELMDEAQKKNDKAYKTYVKTMNELTSAKIEKTEVKFESNRIKSVEDVLPNSKQAIAEVVSSAADLSEFLAILKSLVEKRAVKSLKDFGKVVENVGSNENPKQALKVDADLRSEVLTATERLVNDSVLLHAFSQAYTTISNDYITNYLSNMVKFQTSEGAELEKRLEGLEAYKIQAKESIRATVREAVKSVRKAHSEWAESVAGFLAKLGVSSDVATA
jgi:hypothetical protein